jgi:hypothetical protein
MFLTLFSRIGRVQGIDFTFSLKRRKPGELLLGISRGRPKVKMEGFEEVRRLSKFMNLDFHQI